MGIIGEEPVLSRLDRLDNVLRQLEEMRGSNNNNSHSNRSPSPRSSSASTPSSGKLTSTCTDGHPSSADFSPSSKTPKKYCRPLEHVMVETQLKGTLIQRLEQAEDRLLKLEEEFEDKKRKEASKAEKKVQKKGIKQFLKQCVIGKHSQAEWKVSQEGSKIK